MNIFKELNSIGINTKCLDKKKQQTDYKIKYIKEYVVGWVSVSANRPKVNKINFIDCMCNAGVYQDGDLCTSMEVLKVFLDIAPKYPGKDFNLFLNDLESSKIDAIKQVIGYLMPIATKNIHVFISQKDVNLYLNRLTLHDKMFKYNCATVLYVDPYDFGTVHIKEVRSFVEKFYCELIFNFFISDYVRNGIDERIKKCIDSSDVHNKDDLINYITSQLKVGSMKFLFSYKFKTLKNTELYQIIFVTPNKRGLEVLKDALWVVFNGQFFHRNSNSSDQMSFFTLDNEKAWLLELHSREAKKILLDNFNSKCMSYEEIEMFLIENSMLSSSQIIDNVLKPLIASKQIVKKDLVQRKSNYKNDSYEIIGGSNENDN
jgi:hypothetical protein